MHCSSHLKIKSSFLFPGYNLLLLFSFLSFIPPVSHSLSLIQLKSLNLSLSQLRQVSQPLTLLASPTPTQLATTDRPHHPHQPTNPHHPHKPTDPLRPHRPSNHRPISPIAHLPLFADLAHLAMTEPPCSDPSPKPQAASRCCRPSLFSLCYDCVFLFIYLCIFIWVWWLWWWWLILGMVVVVDDFDSGFVDVFVFFFFFPMLCCGC